jgi:SRSO17 transposase
VDVMGGSQVGSLVGYDRTGLDLFCADVFAPLRRADQRRVGRDYLNALLLLSGRRTARRIATAADRGLTDAGVQQFVNHSPWPDSPVRQRVHARLAGASSPLGLPVSSGWVLDEVAFPKNGRYSAGVARQPSAWTGTTTDCQVGVALSVLTEDAAAPVSWRLALPPGWDGDAERRRRARVPDQVRSRPFWRHAVSLLDELLLDWEVLPAPVLADLRGRSGVDLLVDALERRGLDYVLRVDPDLEVLTGRAATTGAPRPVSGRRQGGLVATTLAELARPAAARRRSTVVWADGLQQHPRRSQFVSLPVDLVAAGDGAVSLAGTADRPLILVVDWPAGRPEPRDAWLTTLSQLRLGDLVALTASSWRTRAAILELGERFGLFDHEGRTFAGWHHHLTLAGAGYTFALERTRLGRPAPGVVAESGQARVLLSNTRRRSPSAT